MDLGLDGRAYVLTGASRGLGLAAARCLVADGARVVISSRTKDNVDAAVEALNAGANTGAGDRAGDPRAGDPRAVGLAADLADPETPARLMDAAASTFGRLDGALLSVGGPPPGTAAQVSDDQWRQAFESVFLGGVRAMRAVLARVDPGGAVGLVLSTSARTPMTGLGISNGLRPGLAGVVKDMADEYGPNGRRVFGLMPHRILTDRLHEIFAASGDPETARTTAESAIPLCRIGDPMEFGRVAAFLLSPAASYLTGLCVPIDGGALRTI
jgi:3-oxoacyl-[acyl-carrier protein] reductase